TDLDRGRIGVRRLRLGLAEASCGSHLLAEGGDQAQAGAAAIAVGLDQAAANSAQATSALAAFASGTRQLASAQQKALLGALAIKFGTTDLGTNLRTNPLPRAHRLDDSLAKELGDVAKLQGPAGAAQSQLQTAFSQLQGMTIGTGDPNYPAALNAVRQALAAVSGSDPVTSAPYAAGYNGLPQDLSALHSAIRQNSIDADEVAHWMDTIDSGLKRLRAASLRLYNGMRRLRSASTKLAGAGGGACGRDPALGPRNGRTTPGAHSAPPGQGQVCGGSWPA